LSMCSGLDISISIVRSSLNFFQVNINCKYGEFVFTYEDLFPLNSADVQHQSTDQLDSSSSVF
jgi:hypothetical protein